MFVYRIVILFSLYFYRYTFANPIGIQEEPHKALDVRADPVPSAYPWASEADPVLKNEFSWVNWDVNNADDKRDGQKIHQAFREWSEFAQAGYGAAKKYKDTPPANALFARWFGKPDFPDEVESTFEAMFDGDTTDASTVIGEMVLDRVDFNDPGSRCSDKPNMKAYTTPGTGRFHFCPAGIALPLNSQINCEDLDAYVSSKMRSVSMTFLHETTHFTKIDHTTDNIEDFASGSYRCFSLDDEEKIHNAQNYAWMTGDAYWSAKCGKTFEDPPEGALNVNDPDDLPNQPSSTPAAPSPTPTPSSTSAPPPLTRALGIVIEAPDSYDAESHPETAWLFFTTDYGHTVDCRADTDTVLNFARPENLDQPAVYPGGTYDLKLDGKDCQYKNDGTNSGRIFCGDTQIACYDDPAHKPGVNINRSNIDGDNYMCGLEYRQPMFTCPW